MNLKSIYLWIFLIVLLGIIIGYFLIPTKEEIALAQLKSNKFNTAEGYYKKEYDKGNRSPDIIIGLSRAYENEGNLTDAISVMRSYVKLHPDDMLALKRLADLYSANQQYDDYYKALIIYQNNSLKLNPDVSHELRDWYKSINNQNSMILILTELIYSGKADDSDYYELAYLYAVQKQYEDARILMEAKRHLFPDNESISDILFEVWMSMEASKTNKTARDELKQKATRITASFLIEKKDPKIIYYALGYFKEHYPDLTPELINELTPIDPLIQKHPHLQALVYSIQWDDPREKKNVTKKLIELFDEGNLTDPLMQSLAFNIFLEMDNDYYIKKLIPQIHPENLDERSIFNLSIIALTRDKPILAKEMQAAFNKDYLEKHQVLAILLEIGAQDKDAREKLNTYMKTPLLNQIDRFFLFRIAAQAKFDKEALEIGPTLVPYSGLSENDLIDIALEYATMDKAKELYGMIQNSIPMIGEGIAEPALAVLDISLHHTQKVAEWVQKQENIKENTLSALYSTAEGSKEYPLALYIAKRRRKDYPTNIAEADYALALVQVGKVENGIAILKQLFAENPSNINIERDYFNALATAAKKNPAYEKDLLAFMTEREKVGPLLKDQIKEYEYTYLDVLHDFKNAERLLQILAEKGSPKSEEVQTLIYLWGPHPSQAKIDWIESRAIHAKPEHLSYWLEDLNFVGRHETVAYLFQNQEEVTDPKAYFAYMDALAYLKRKEELRDAFDSSWPLMKTVKDFERLAGYAEEAEYLEGRTLAREKIVELTPKDSKAWQNLATANFDQHDYCATSEALQNFFSLSFPETDTQAKFYESMYQYSEVLRQERCFEQADNFAQLTIEKIQSAKEKTARMIELESLLYYRLDARPTALRYMKKLFEMTGRDADVTAAYASMLMDVGYFHDARRLLENSLSGNSELEYIDDPEDPESSEQCVNE